MALTGAQFKDAVESFARTISKHKLGLAIHRPDPDAQPTNCVANALAAQEQRGGQIRYGWYFHLRYALQFGDSYLIAIHHAVWHDPSDCNLVDVTPFHSEELHHPFTQNGNVLFLLDPNATPLVKDDKVIPLPSQFFPASQNTEFGAYVKRLQKEEYDSYNKLHGTDFA